MAKQLHTAEGKYYVKEPTQDWPDGRWREISEHNYNVERALDAQANPSGIPGLNQVHQSGIGAMRSFSDLGQGIQSLMPWEDGQGIRSDMQQRNQDFQEGAGGYMGPAQDVGGFIPDAMTALIPGKMPIQAGIGALEGAARMPEEPWKGAGYGLAATYGGAYGGQMVNRIVGNIRSAGKTVRSDMYEQSVINKGEDAGLQWTPGQRSGDEGQLRLENQIRKDPAFANLDQARREHNQRVLNNHATETLGIKGRGKVTPDIMADAVDNVSEAFDAAARASDGAELDPVNLIQMEEGLTPEGDLVWNKFKNVFGDIAESNKMSGEEFNQARNWLADQGRKGGPKINDDVQDMISLFDNALEQQNPQVAKEIAQARKMWKSILVLEGSMGGAANSAAGDISPLGAYRALSRYEKGDFARNREKNDPFMNAVRAMSMTNDTKAGQQVSAGTQGVLKRVEDFLINKPLARDYMEGGSVGRTLMGLTEDLQYSPAASKWGIGSSRAALQGLMGLDEEDAALMP